MPESYGPGGCAATPGPVPVLVSGLGLLLCMLCIERAVKGELTRRMRLQGVV